jgi:hypothetical protein
MFTAFSFNKATTEFDLFLSGAASLYDQGTLEGKLTGETFTTYTEVEGNIFAYSSTDFEVNANAFTGVSTGTANLFPAFWSTKTTTLNERAFNSNARIESVKVPNCTVVGNLVFEGCYLSGSCDFSGVQVAGGRSFRLVKWDDNLDNFYFPTLISASGESFARNTQITQVTDAEFPSLLNINDSAGVYGGPFLSCSALLTASLSGITNICRYAFYNCGNLNYLDFPNVTTIDGVGNGGGMELVQGLTEVNNTQFPSLTTIGQSGFNSCPNLVSASLQDLTSVGASAFANCTSLKYVDFTGLANTTTALGGGIGDNGVFANVGADGVIYIPVYFETVNGGGRDGDLSRLASQGWTINYV